ncbi:MAG: glycosyltransferase family 4 protein [Zavarzinella sp.]
MKIAYLIHRFPPAIGGAERWLELLAQYGVQAGDEIDVWTTTANKLESFQKQHSNELSSGTMVQDGVTVRRFPLIRFPGRKYLLKAASLALKTTRWGSVLAPYNPICPEMWRQAGSHSNRSNYDLVHAFAFPFGFIMAAAHRLSQQQKIPLIISPYLHLGNPQQPHNRIRRAYTSKSLAWWLRQADCVLVQSSLEQAAVLEMGVAPKRIRRTAVGVPPLKETGDAARFRKQYGISSTAKLVGHLATLSEEKGTVDLLDAFRSVHMQIPDAICVLAGPSTSQFTSRFPPDSLPPWVKMVGVLSEEQKNDFYEAIDLFCLPSRNDSFGIVFLEAWQHAKPVIGYRAGGVADLILHDSDGFLVECGDLNQLAEKIVQLLTKKELAAKFGKSGQARVVREFTADQRLTEIRTIQQEILWHEKIQFGNQTN